MSALGLILFQILGFLCSSNCTGSPQDESCTDISHKNYWSTNQWKGDWVLLVHWHFLWSWITGLSKVFTFALVWSVEVVGGRVLQLCCQFSWSRITGLLWILSPALIPSAENGVKSETVSRFLLFACGLFQPPPNKYSYLRMGQSCFYFFLFFTENQEYLFVLCKHRKFELQSQATIINSVRLVH